MSKKYQDDERLISSLTLNFKAGACVMDDAFSPCSRSSISLSLGGSMRSHIHLQFHNKSSLLLYEAPMALTLAPSVTMFNQFLLYCSGPAKALLTTLVYT